MGFQFDRALGEAAWSSEQLHCPRFVSGATMVQRKEGTRMRFVLLLAVLCWLAMVRGSAQTLRFSAPPSTSRCQTRF